MTTTIEAAYEGSGSVRIDGRLFSFPNKEKGDGYGGVMPKAARKLIREGMDPETPVHVTRNRTKVYPKDWTLKQWASVTYEEPDNAKHSVRQRPYRAPPSERMQVNSVGGGGQECPATVGSYQDLSEAA